MIGERIKQLREQCGWTQAELSRKLSITRSSVNAWEMGISVPSTILIIELAKLFHVSTDYLLGVSETSTLDISSLNDKEVLELVQYFKSLKK